MIILVTKIETSAKNFSEMASFYSQGVDLLCFLKFTLNVKFLRTSNPSPLSCFQQHTLI